TKSLKNAWENIPGIFLLGRKQNPLTIENTESYRGNATEGFLCVRALWNSVSSVVAFALDLILPQNPNHSPLNLHRGSRNNNRLHIYIGRLQADVVAFAIEALKSGVIFVNQGHNDVSIVRGLHSLNQHVVAIQNVLILHGFPTHFEHI